MSEPNQFRTLEPFTHRERILVIGILPAVLFVLFMGIIFLVTDTEAPDYHFSPHLRPPAAETR